jgi:uncharacterized protein (TIGR03086 family)
MTTEQRVFILADEAVNRVVGRIKDDQWGLKIPHWFQVWRSDEDLTLRKIVHYLAYDLAWVPDVLAGKTVAEVGDAYKGDLLGADPKASFAALAVKAKTAAAALGDLEQTVHLSYGDFPAREYLKHITGFHGFRAHDIARLTGSDTKLPDDLVQGLWDELSPDIEQMRAMGAYGPAVPVPEDADLQTKLLGMVGRTAA